MKEIGNGTVAHGKFDQNAFDEPYSGISAVFGELCDMIFDGADQGDKDLIPVKQSILFELMWEIRLL